MDGYLLIHSLKEMDSLLSKTLVVAPNGGFLIRIPEHQYPRFELKNGGRYHPESNIVVIRAVWPIPIAKGTVGVGCTVVP